jgi:hypothetical protein
MTVWQATMRVSNGGTAAENADVPVIAVLPTAAGFVL